MFKFIYNGKSGYALGRKRKMVEDYFEKVGECLYEERIFHFYKIFVDKTFGILVELIIEPWNGKVHYGIVIHLQGTKVCLEFDSEVERSAEFNRIAEELKR